MADPRIDTLLLALDNAFDGKGWQGATLVSALRDVTGEQATRKVPGIEHSIWEHLLHTAYWKHTARRYLLGIEEEDFPREPNWPTPGDSLDADRDFLRETHTRLRATIGLFDPERLDVVPVEGAPTYAELIVGIAAHDTHHTGQIQMLKRLLPTP